MTLPSSWLAELERQLAADEEPDLLVRGLCVLALAGGQDIAVPDGELNAAGRCALLMLASGGDPQRGLDLHGRAVGSMASDLDSPARRELLQGGLRAVSERATGLPHVTEVLRSLMDDPEIAWSAYAAARLAEILGDAED
ncbi:MAG: hypothetical protein OXG37_14390 [Actinomycetia bacterium]|nr:hypothetical protein [Actinomycetes bacterium]